MKKSNKRPLTGSGSEDYTDLLFTTEPPQHQIAAVAYLVRGKQRTSAVAKGFGGQGLNRV
jgi:hypothetical protein